MNTLTLHDYLTKGTSVHHGKQLVGYKYDDPNGGERFYYLNDLNEIINQIIIDSKNKNEDDDNTIGSDNTTRSGGSHKRSRRHSKKQKRVRYTRRKQTRRHRHRHSRRR